MDGKRPAGLVRGVNIGENLTTSLEHAGEDYLSLVKTSAPPGRLPDDQRQFAEHARAAHLQTRSALEALLRPLDAERRVQSQRLGRHVPLLVKRAPDLTSDELDGALDALLGGGHRRGDHVEYDAEPQGADLGAGERVRRHEQWRAGAAAQHPNRA